MSASKKIVNPSPEVNSRDKRLIEAIKARLNEKLQDPKNAKKAALILELWIHQKPK